MVKSQEKKLMFLAEEEKINYVEIYGAFSITKAYIARDEWWGGGGRGVEVLREGCITQLQPLLDFLSLLRQ